VPPASLRSAGPVLAPSGHRTIAANGDSGRCHRCGWPSRFVAAAIDAPIVSAEQFGVDRDNQTPEVTLRQRRRL
jgi:hypothetical protein